MLHLLPSELIYSIASQTNPETRSELTKTCRRCYESSYSLLWCKLLLETMDRVHTIAKRVHDNQWGPRAMRYVRDIDLASPAVRHYTLDDIQLLLGSFDSGYSTMHQLQEPSTNDSLINTKFSSFLYQLDCLFPRTKRLCLDFYLIMAALDGDLSNYQSHFDGKLIISHYRPGSAERLKKLLTAFPHTTSLELKIQQELTCSESTPAMVRSSYQECLMLSILNMSQLETIYVSGITSPTLFWIGTFTWHRPAASSSFPF
ncbi:hypothetical protein DM01DRAFT_1349480 [Hesseltinella vesiculosa]|uniref:F-box domain-containing protein n=1 Tax=Hesseltinella vesiculosa TaxID=101127 RepID=A0A1X2G5B9_9FUNG|nr:hypothetical protein DM01DRAFT_1349480 [Hesseltinella vesiculosa]